MTTYEDPGWLPAVHGVWRYLVPIGRIRRARRARNGLLALRSVFLGFVASLFLFFVVLSLIAPWDGGDEGWVPWAVIAYGIGMVMLVATIRRRPLPMGSPASPESIAAWYQTTFFLELALSDAAAIMSFVGVFVAGSLWIYAVGLVLGLIGMWMTAPSRGDIERRQREITAAGSPVSLLDALTSSPPPRP